MTVTVRIAERTTAPPPERVRRVDGCTMLDLQARRPIAYRIVNVDEPAFDLCNPHLATFVKGRQTLVIADDRVMSLYGDLLVNYLSKKSDLASCMTVPGRESAKRWESVERICRRAVECRLDGSAVMIGFGGGIVMDLVGVAASLYRRGIGYLRIPTTLIGIVDVAVGIKTAFNFIDKKNALGSFHPPIGAIADRRLLQTLEKRHVACGLAEILKMGIVRDAYLFELAECHAERLLSSNFLDPPDIAEEILLRAQAAMMDELEPNLFENDKRRLVDFGHTVSPLLETATNYALHHGEAVAIDMLLSTAIAVVEGLCEFDCLSRLRSIYGAVGLPKKSNALTISLIMASFEEAYKHRNGNLNLVVPLGIGTATYVQDVKTEKLRQALLLLE
jgi:2-epi-5-epi-valiolone synthase